MRAANFLALLAAVMGGCYLDLKRSPTDAKGGSFDGGLDASGAGDSDTYVPPDATVCCINEVCCIDGSCCPGAGHHDGSISDAASGDARSGDGATASCSASAECPATLPVCKDHVCARCESAASCNGFADAGLPVCSTSGACVECSPGDDSKCVGTGTPVCDPLTSQCVECTETSADACTAANGRPVCKTGGTECVACNKNIDCPAANPVCSANHECTPCTADHQCDHGVCDEAAGPFQGQCVECTQAPADEQRCQGTSCNPATRSCTSTPLGKTTDCQPCLADSECIQDHRCVPMFFNGSPYPPFSPDKGGGGYCLRQVSATCSKPYPAMGISRVSVSGAAADDYCGVEESLTTCEAVLRFGASCPSGDPSTCAGEGARCETVAGIPNICTYSCDTALQCPKSSTATEIKCASGSTSDNYCGALN